LVDVSKAWKPDIIVSHWHPPEEECPVHPIDYFFLLKKNRPKCTGPILFGSFHPDDFWNLQRRRSPLNGNGKRIEDFETCFDILVPRPFWYWIDTMAEIRRCAWNLVHDAKNENAILPILNEAFILKDNEFQFFASGKKPQSK
jgi:hypothetical protein